eukprot:s5211_g2.t1
MRLLRRRQGDWPGGLVFPGECGLALTKDGRLHRYQQPGCNQWKALQATPDESRSFQRQCLQTALVWVQDELLTRTSSWLNQDAPQQARRAAGALLGLAVADWVGAPLEFLEVTDDPGESRWDHDSFHCHNPNTTEIERGILKPGQWTDDTSMALCLADSLCICGQLDGSDLRKRSFDASIPSTGPDCLEAMNTPWRLDPDRKKRTSFGLGYNIAKSLIALYPDEPIDPEYLNPGSSDSGNGGLMRLAPVPIFYSRPEQLEDLQ